MSKSETARALDELGFEYNEYMDDSDLLGDDSNDEVSYDSEIHFIISNINNCYCW